MRTEECAASALSVTLPGVYDESHLGETRRKLAFYAWQLERTLPSLRPPPPSTVVGWRPPA